MRVPAALYHRPVSLVAVHCDLHTSAAACYPALECAVVQLLEQILELLDVDLRSLRGNVTAVQQGVYSYLGDTLGLSLLYHVEQVLDVGMYVAVGQQTDEMHGGVLALYVSSQFLPCVGFVHLAALDALVNELCALRVDLTAADRVVTYLGVAHVVVGGQTYRVTVRLEAGVGAVSQHPVEGGGVSLAHCVAEVGLGEANAVHYY